MGSGKERNRPLTSDERTRLALFQETAARLEAAGYERTELTISIVRANLYAILVALFLLIGGTFLYLTVRGEVAMDTGGGGLLTIIVSFVVLTVVHELVHGLTWAMFTEHHWGDIAFGIMRRYFTPYCSCKVPLAKGPYITGVLMPLVVTGIVPALIALAVGSFLWFIIGIIMMVSATGDVMIAVGILMRKSSATEAVYLDHPTLGGVVVFER